MASRAGAVDQPARNRPRRARLYTALAAAAEHVDGITVLDPDLLAEATSVQSEGWCPVLEREATFGLGFQPTRPDRPFGPNPGSFGHFGTGAHWASLIRRPASGSAM